MYGSVRDFLENELAEIRDSGLHKSERVITTPQDARIRVGVGEPVLNMCANNYLGLAHHPEVIAAAREALDRWGYGLSSVRFICGTQEVDKNKKFPASGRVLLPRSSVTAPPRPHHGRKVIFYSPPPEGDHASLYTLDPP